MNIQRLLDILALKRGHGSEGEAEMIAKVIMPYDPIIFADNHDEYLAYCISVGEGSRTLFSAHVDTVHGRPLKVIKPADDLDAPQSFVNDFTYDETTNTLHAKGDVLGADDGAGLWLLLEMIDAGVPGHYLLHHGEECGGIGSRGMTTHHAEFLEQFDRAIAFDRKATHSVITHQGWGRCCSDMFATALADALSCDTYFFSPDDGGVFTDTANYVDYIGECTNVSVGYYSEHTHTERLDLNFLISLREKCIKLNWEELPSKRMPGEVESKSWGSYSRGSYKGMTQAEWDYEYGYYRTGLSDPVPTPNAKKRAEDITVDDLYDMDYIAMMDFIEDEPYDACRLMWEMMYGKEAGGLPLDPEDDLDDTDAFGDDEEAAKQKLDVGMR